MKKFMSLVLTSILFGGSGLAMAQTVPDVAQTGENEGAYGTDTAEVAGAASADAATEAAEAPETTG